MLAANSQLLPNAVKSTRNSRERMRGATLISQGRDTEEEKRNCRPTKGEEYHFFQCEMKFIIAEQCRAILPNC